MDVMRWTLKISISLQEKSLGRANEICPQNDAPYHKTYRQTSNISHTKYKHL